MELFNWLVISRSELGPQILTHAKAAKGTWEAWEAFFNAQRWKTWSRFFFGEILFYLLWKPGSKVKHVVLETNGAKRKNLWDRLSMIVKFHGIPNYALDHSPK